MWWINCGNEKWDSTSYKISERYDSEAKWMAFLSFLDVLPKDSRLFAHLVKFCSSAQCLQISIRWCSNQASQYGVQYPTHMPEWRKTDCHGTRTDIPFDHHNLDKTVSKFISQRKSNILVSSSYTPQMRSFSLSQSVSSILLCILRKKHPLRALSDKELRVSWELKAMYCDFPHNTALKKSSPFIRTAEDSITDFFVSWVVQGVRLVLELAVCELIDCISDLFTQSTWIGCLWGRGREWNAIVEE